MAGVNHKLSSISLAFVYGIEGLERATEESMEGVDIPDDLEGQKGTDMWLSMFGEIQSDLNNPVRGFGVDADSIGEYLFGEEHRHFEERLETLSEFASDVASMPVAEREGITDEIAEHKELAEELYKEFQDARENLPDY